MGRGDAPRASRTGRPGAGRTLRIFSYGMIAAFGAGLVYTGVMTIRLVLGA